MERVAATRLGREAIVHPRRMNAGETFEMTRRGIVVALLEPLPPAAARAVEDDR